MARRLNAPKLLYETEVWRAPYRRRFPLLLLGAAAAAGAYWALSLAQRRALADPLLLDIGRLVAVVLAGLLVVLAGLSLFRAITRRDTRIRVFDQGIIWRTRRMVDKYPWTELSRYREGASGLTIGGRTLVHWGAHELIMRDGAKFRFSYRQGDPQAFARVVRRYASRITGIRMGRTLREEQPVQIHPKLTVYPGGVEARGREIPWSQLDVQVRGHTLRVRQKQPNGKFRTVARYNTRTITNLGGFMEVAVATLRNHQPERFRKRATSEQRRVPSTRPRSAPG